MDVWDTNYPKLNSWRTLNLSNNERKVTIRKSLVIYHKVISYINLPIRGKKVEKEENNRTGGKIEGFLQLPT